MKTETFPDGSTIDTDETTGNRTVCGKQAHEEYFRRLKGEYILSITSPAVMAFCRNVDGSRKCELIRKHVENPLTREWLGEYSWEVWESSDPKMVKRFMDADKARKYFTAAMLNGTNGIGVAC